MAKQKLNNKTIAVLGILIGAVSISFLMIPVAVGAIAKGPWAGALLGTVFGITSFVQCFGMDPFGTYLASKNVFFTFIMCIICRALAGFLAGLVFKGISKLTKNTLVRSSLTGLAAALFNTILFLGALVLLFGKATTSEAMGIGDPSIGVIALIVAIAAIVGINAVLEAVASFILTGAVGAALFKAKLIEK